MAGKVLNSWFVLLIKFGLVGQEGSPKTATSPIRKTKAVFSLYSNILLSKGKATTLIILIFPNSL